MSKSNPSATIWTALYLNRIVDEFRERGCTGEIGAQAIYESSSIWCNIVFSSEREVVHLKVILSLSTRNN